ncbi:Xaa-Pro peptidase family protein [Ferrovibrio terrae]|jgi:Xaa-Pro aminopeptidase|uniref:M24 family metallopeptidase n=1 Tax=Ferrovibrio terrae TaxID=2594003 RepID=UPI0031382257
MTFLSHAVRDSRLGAMRQLMERLRFDALIFTAADFFQYATNFHVDVQPWERPIMVVVPRDGKPRAIMNELSTHHMMMARERGHVWLDEIEFYAEHPKVAERQYLLPQLPEIATELLKKAGLSASRIGVDGTPGFLARAAAALPDMKLVPCLGDMRSLRWVKHPEEIEVMRQASALSDWVQERYRENIRPGRLVQELDYQMASLMVEEGAKRFPGANLEVMRCWTLSGPASASPHGDGASCGARISKGDVLVNIVIPRLNGIVIENERTWFAGAPSADQRKFYEVARAANEAATGAAVTGKAVSSIDAAAQHVIEKAGCSQYIRHRTGHGMGILGHEYPDDMAFNHRALLKDEVYSAEPGIYVYGLGGFRLDDTVVVGEQPEILTKSPRNIENQIIN